MNTTCPNCQTEFNIPDSVYVPGRKARCAICSHVFVLPEVPGFVPHVQATQPAQPAQPAAQAAPAPQPAAAPASGVRVSVNFTPAQAQPQAAQAAPQQQVVQQPAAPQPPQPAPAAPAAPQQVAPQPAPAQPQVAQQQPVQPQPVQAEPDFAQPQPAGPVPQPEAFAAPQPEFQPAPTADPFAQAMEQDAAFAQGQDFAPAASAPGVDAAAPGTPQAAPQPVSQPAPQPAEADPFAAFAAEEPQGNVIGAGDAHDAFAEAAARHAFNGAGVEAGGHFGGQAAAGNSGLPGAGAGQSGDAASGSMDFADILGAEAAAYDPFASDPASSPAPEQGATGIGEQAAPPAEEDDIQARMAKFDADLDAVLNESPAKGDAAASETDDSAGQKKSGGKKIFRLLLLLICLGGLGFGGYWAYNAFFAKDGGQDGDGRNIVNIEANELEKVRNLDVKSSGVKYEYVKNDKLGTILVLEGKVTNHFTAPKNRITVEARLFNAKGEVIKSQRQVCGVVLTPLQLSVLGQKELAKALNNRIEIMANNMGVQPGADVPFMVVFVYPPSHAVEFDVTVVDASDNAEPSAPAAQ
ncbi:zinc-ribbon domain-containing protein [Desulfovibrio sp. OttesenSCG-928-C06]|nr:zinc-ribbon domain-containing protein [Desulfovibrio sp. OttesenSCG-928-C06]